MSKDNIVIEDWTGKALYVGSYRDVEAVDAVLDANKCPCESDGGCYHCEGTGYVGDYEIYWVIARKENVYEVVGY